MSAGSSDPRDVEGFLAYLADYRGLAPNTIDSYRADLRIFADFVEAKGRELAEATEADVREFIRARTEAGSSAATVNRGLYAVRSLFRFLRSMGVVATDPTFRLPAQPEPDLLPWPLTHEEMSLLLDVGGDGFIGARDRLLLHLLYSTGCLISEAVGIDLEQIGEDGTIAIRGKGGAVRDLFLVPAARLALARYLPIREARLEHFRRRNRRSIPDAEVALFLDGRAHRLTDRGARLLVTARGKEALPDGRRVSPRVIRDTFAVHVLGAGAPLIATRDFLGHVKITTTARYGRVVDPLREPLLDALPHGREEPTEEPATKKRAANA